VKGVAVTDETKSEPEPAEKGEPVRKPPPPPKPRSMYAKTEIYKIGKPSAQEKRAQDASASHTD
jgi:hypothetical protein